MTDIIDMGKGAVDALLKMPTILLLCPAMIALAWALQRTRLPSRIITLIVVFLPSFLMVFLLPFKPGDMAPGIAHPAVEFIIRCSVIGLIIGFVARASHKALLERVAKVIPGFDPNASMAQGDTTTLKKPEPSPPDKPKDK